MRLAVAGASGGIGRAVVEAALAGGHDVVALTRERARLADLGQRGLAVIEGDIRLAGVADQFIANAEVVISALGASANEPSAADEAEGAMAAIVSAMGAAGVDRLVALSGAAVTLPGEVKPVSGRLAAWIVDRAAHWVVEAKRREAADIMGSELAWTLVRPPNVVPGEAQATVGLRASLPARSFRVTQGDVASALLRCANDGIYVREAPFVG